MQPYRKLSIATRDYMWQVLDEDHLTYLRHLQVNLTQVLGGARFYLCHAAPSNDLYRYLPYDSPDAVWQDEAARVEADVILIGHTHQQFVKQVGQKTFLNSGSLGQPKGVGPVACYAIWEDGQVELKRIPYPFRETMAKIDHTPLAPAIKEKLKADGVQDGWGPMAHRGGHLPHATHLASDLLPLHRLGGTCCRQ
jgi:protein phosphatase